MKKILILICAGFMLASTSCKKDKDNDTSPATRSEMIKGTWTVKEIGFDSNNNNTLDTNEVAFDDAGSMTFNAEGSGSGKLFGVSYPFTWSLINNDNTVRVTLPTEVIDYEIKEMTANRAVVVDASENPATWSVLTK